MEICSAERRLKFHVYLKKKAREKRKRNLSNNLSIFSNIRFVFRDRSNEITRNYIIYIYIYKTTRVSNCVSFQKMKLSFARNFDSTKLSPSATLYLVFLTCVGKVANLLGAALERESWRKKHLSFPMEHVSDIMSEVWT